MWNEKEATFKRLLIFQDDEEGNEIVCCPPSAKDRCCHSSCRGYPDDVLGSKSRSEVGETARQQSGLVGYFSTRPYPITTRRLRSNWSDLSGGNAPVHPLHGAS